MAITLTTEEDQAIRTIVTKGNGKTGFLPIPTTTCRSLTDKGMLQQLLGGWEATDAAWQYVLNKKP